MNVYSVVLSAAKDRGALRSDGTGSFGAIRTACVISLLLLPSCDRTPPDPVESVPIGTAVGERPPPLEGRLDSGDQAVLLQPGSAGPTVLVFYRSAQCGLCRVQLQQLQQYLPAYQRQSASVLGVTLDSSETSRALAEEMGLGFPLVSVDSATFRRWDVMPSDGVPLPATYVIDRNGVIRFRHIGRNASDRTNEVDLITILEGVSTR